jgi:hypothetical protein
MPFKVIPGTYHVVGFAPDGDSIRFKPTRPEQLQELDNVPFDLKPDRPVQLRIEAIDTLETHYSLKSGGTVHQPLAQAHSARAALIDFVGIRNVVWGADGKVKSAKDGTHGYILARAFEKNGRVVAFVFAGDAPGAQEVRLEPAQLRESFNFKATAEGFAYPTFYHGLFADLRKVLAAAAAVARTAGQGVYANDATSSGFVVNSLLDLTEKHVILPKLFRRLAEYVAVNGSAAGFKAALEVAREPVLDLRNDANFTHFDTFVTESGTTIALTRSPEELVFDPMPARPSDAFASMLATQAPSRDQVHIGVPVVNPAPAPA